MQPRYDWQKGQDAWDAVEISRQEPERVQGPLRQGLWRYGLAVVLIIGLIGASVVWFVTRRAKTNTAAVEDDILRTNSLIFQAVAAGDEELLRSNLSGRNPYWVTLMSDLLSTGAIYDREMWGLSYDPAVLDDSRIRIALNPAWDEAELIFPLDFVHHLGGGVTQTVQLEQTLIYRRSRERWLLAPVDVDFWGERLSFEGRYLNLDYPARDREIVERLAADLDRLVGDICADLADPGCSAGFRMAVRFYESTPDIAAITSPMKFLPCGEDIFELPPPTLVGLPVDEAGYEALLQGYRAEMAALTIAHLLYPSNCDYSRLRIALLDYRLSELGMRPWPMVSDDYVNLWSEQFHLEQMYFAVQKDRQTVWNVVPGTGVMRPYYALIAFLTEVYGTSPAEIERYLDRERLTEDLYWSTLHNWSDQNFADNYPLELAWGKFLEEKAGDGVAVGPDLPDQDLRLVCYGGNITTGIAYPNGVLYEVDLETGEMTAVYPLNHTDAYLTPLPHDRGTVVVEQRLDFVREPARVLVWEEGEPIILFETSDNLEPVSIFDFRDQGEQLLVYDSDDQKYGGYLLADCGSEAGCRRLDYGYGGFPILSPSGERFMSLLSIGNHGYESQYFRPFSMNGLTTYSDSLTGKSPFWLSEERIGFIVGNGRAVTALTIAGEDFPEQREVLFTLEEVDPSLALDETAVIEAVLSNPNEPEDLMVVARNGQGWVSIYQVNILRRWIQRLKEWAFLMVSDAVYDFEFSPEGGWLVVSGEYLVSSGSYLHLFDIRGNEMHSFEYQMEFDRPVHWAMDWSAGDEWLAIPDNGYIRLIKPAADYQEVIVPDGVNCSGAVWVN